MAESPCRDKNAKESLTTSFTDPKLEEGNERGRKKGKKLGGNCKSHPCF
jgi:hypothetical protein